MKNEKQIVKMVDECCHHCVFCFYEFILKDCEDNDNLFNHFVRSLKEKYKGCDEFYVYDEMYSDNWLKKVARPMQFYLELAYPSLSFSVFYFELEQMIKNNKLNF